MTILVTSKWKWIDQNHHILYTKTKNEPKVENIIIKKNILKVHKPKWTKFKNTGLKAVFKLI